MFEHLRNKYPGMEYHQWHMPVCRVPWKSRRRLAQRQIYRFRISLVG
jgi:hypothetical protein